MLRKRSALVTALLFVSLFGLLLGCGGDEDISGPEGSSTVTLSFTGLEPLPGDLNYQAWLVAGTSESFWGYPLVLFDMDETGQMMDPAADSVYAQPFQAGIDPDEVLGIGVSLELTDELTAYSSYTFILYGPNTQGVVDLSIEGWLAFDRSLADVAGGYILATPTDEDPENEMSGVWFLDPGAEVASASLILPDAPEGWNYESWVEVEDQTLSMGKFPFPNLADSSSTYSGTLDAPPFPGEDFLTSAPEGLTFPTDLSGSSVFVTVEPWAEWDTEPTLPFYLRILEAQIPADATPQTLYEMVSLTGQLPTGSATIIKP